MGELFDSFWFKAILWICGMILFIVICRLILELILNVFYKINFAMGAFCKNHGFKYRSLWFVILCSFGVAMISIGFEKISVPGVNPILFFVGGTALTVLPLLHLFVNCTPKVLFPLYLIVKIVAIPLCLIEYIVRLIATFCLDSDEIPVRMSHSDDYGDNISAFYNKYKEYLEIKRRFPNQELPIPIDLEEDLKCIGVTLDQFLKRAPISYKTTPNNPTPIYSHSNGYESTYSSTEDTYTSAPPDKYTPGEDYSLEKYQDPYHVRTESDGSYHTTTVNGQQVSYSGDYAPYGVGINILQTNTIGIGYLS